MIFSASHHSNKMKQAGEIRCPYNQLGTIIKFIKENPSKRYNIIIPDDLTQIQLKKLAEQVDIVKTIAEDYTIQCGNILQLRDLKDMGYNRYLRFPVTDWETLEELREAEVSDLYIDGPLGFQMDAIAQIKGDIKIRVSPTISPNISISANRKPSSFFIRPEDLSLYSHAIDIIDFKERDQDKEDTLFAIYNRGTFNYDINLLIDGLPARNNLLFGDNFAKKRLNCAQKCNIPGHQCHYCDTYFSVTLKMRELAKSSAKK